MGQGFKDTTYKGEIQQMMLWVLREFSQELTADAFSELTKLHQLLEDELVTGTA